MHGQPMPESFTKGSRSPSSRGRSSSCFAPAAPVPEVRPSRARRSATIFPHLGDGRRRDLHHPLDGHRGDQPRPGPHLHEHRHDHLRPAGDGLVAHLRPGQRERGPARVRRADLDRPVRPGAADRRRQWHSGFLPSRFQGVQFHSKGDPVLYLGNPDGRRPPTASATSSTPSSGSTSSRTERSTTPRSPRGSRQYEMAFRMQTSVPELMDLVERAEARPRPLRHQGRRRLLRRQLPAGPPAGRARRPVHPALPPRLGPPRRHQERHQARTAEEVDQALGRADQGPEAARDARRHAGHLGRRVRPHPDGPGQRPRPPHQGLLDLDGRRRHQGRASPTARPTSSATPPSRTSSTSTTCTPRCSHLLGIDHQRLTYQVPGPRLPADRRRRPGRQADPGLRSRESLGRGFRIAVPDEATPRVARANIRQRNDFRCNGWDIWCRASDEEIELSDLFADPARCERTGFRLEPAIARTEAARATRADRAPVAPASGALVGPFFGGPRA